MIGPVGDTQPPNGGASQNSIPTAPPPAAAKAQGLVGTILNTPPTPQPKNSPPEQKEIFFSPVDIIQTTGMVGTFNPCCIIATLQALKVIPCFFNALQKRELSISINETVEKFELRKNIQKQIFEILKLSLEGKNIPNAKVDTLHTAFSQYDPNTFPPGGGADLLETWQTISKIMEITPLIHTLYGHTGPRSEFEAFYDVTTPKDDYGNCIAKKNFHNCPEIVPVVILSSPHGAMGGGCNFTREVEPLEGLMLNTDRGPIFYELASCVANDGNNAQAFLPDEKHECWVDFCNKKVTILPELTTEQKRRISLLFYRRILKFI